MPYSQNLIPDKIKARKMKKLWVNVVPCNKQITAIGASV